MICLVGRLLTRLSQSWQHLAHLSRLAWEPRNSVSGSRRGLNGACQYTVEPSRVGTAPTVGTCIDISLALVAQPLIRIANLALAQPALPPWEAAAGGAADQPVSKSARNRQRGCSWLVRCIYSLGCPFHWGFAALRPRRGSHAERSHRCLGCQERWLPAMSRLRAHINDGSAH